MSTFTKLVLIGATALGALTAVSAQAATQPSQSREQVLAAHRQVASATPVAYHRHHRHHHRVRHPARPAHR